MRYLLILLTLVAMLFVAGCGEPKVVAEIHHDEAGDHAEGEESHDEGEEHAESEESHSEGEESHAEGESAEGEHAEGETTEGEHSEGEAVEGESVEGEHTEDEATDSEGETTSDETSDAEGETPSNEPAAVEVGPATTSLIESLQASGLEVVAIQPTEASPFAVQGHVIAVNEQPAIVFEYPDAAAAEADTHLVSPDGTAIGENELGTQAGPTHFFHQENLIALYFGDDVAILTALEAALGPQFAGALSVE
jgi:hypothetical protein